MQDESDEEDDHDEEERVTPDLEMSDISSETQTTADTVTLTNDDTETKETTDEIKSVLPKRTRRDFTPIEDLGMKGPINNKSISLTEELFKELVDTSKSDEFKKIAREVGWQKLKSKVYAYRRKGLVVK